MRRLLPLLCMLAAGVSQAQEQEQEQPGVARFDDVMVTATKREKSAREIPVTINAMSGEQLEKMGARDLQDYIALTPGINLQDGQNGSVMDRRISIRGVGPGSGANQTVGQFIGDVPMTDPYSNFIAPDLDPFDLENVEILKGPQGTYFGASALNGAIRYVPAKPELGQLGGRAFVDYLSISQGSAAASYGGALNLPFGDTLALRGMAVLQHAPGIIDNLQRQAPDADGRRKWSGRLAARWEPLEGLSLGALYLRQRSAQHDVLAVDNDEARLENNSRPGGSHVDSSFDLAGIDARYELGPAGTLVLQSSQQHKNALTDFDAGVTQLGRQGIQSLRGFFSADISGVTHELRLVSPNDGRWNWIAGVFLLDYKARADTDIYVNNTAALGLIAQLPVLGSVSSAHGVSYGGQQLTPLSAKESSIYGELTRKLGERWELTAGARFYRTQTGGTETSTGLTSPLLGSFTVDQHAKGISPKFSAVYKLDRNFMAYASVSRGFQFGGVNASTTVLPFNNPLTGAPPPHDFESSSLWSREIGIRTDWLDRTLRADLTYFNLDWTDAQFSVYQDSVLVDATYVDNVGKVRSQGLETTLAWITPLPGLSLNFAGAYTQALTAAPYTGADGEVVPSGTDMPMTPRLQTATTVSHAALLGPWAINTMLVHTWTGPAWNNINHAHRIYDYHALNLSLAIARPDLPMAPSLTVGVTNLTDVRALAGDNSDQSSQSLLGINRLYVRPRALSLRLTAEFQ